MTATLKVGGRVWFFFRHAHGVAEKTESGHTIELFTGVSEMRCRPAVILSVGAPDTNPLTTGFIIEMRSGQVTVPAATPLDLKVEFTADDRIEMPGGVVLRPDRIQPSVLPHDGIEPGKLGRGWPQDRRWADRPHASAKVAASA